MTKANKHKTHTYLHLFVAFNFFLLEYYFAVFYFSTGVILNGDFLVRQMIKYMLKTKDIFLKQLACRRTAMMLHQHSKLLISLPSRYEAAEKARIEVVVVKI